METHMTFSLTIIALIYFMVKARSASGTPLYKFGYTPKNTVEKRGCDRFQEGTRYTKTGKYSSYVFN
jgi:hypothetical protein